MKEIDECAEDTIKTLLLKKELLEILRVRAFRHKNCFGNFMEAIILQEGFAVKSNEASHELIRVLTDKKLSLCKTRASNIYFFITDNLLSDEVLAKRFCQTDANHSRALAQETMIIVNAIAPFEIAVKAVDIDILDIDETSVLAHYAKNAEASIVTLVTKSAIEKRAYTHVLTQIPGIEIIPSFEFTTLIPKNVTASQYRKQIFKSMTTICARLLSLNVNIGFAQKHFTDPKILAELNHAIYLAAVFIFEFLLEVQFPIPEVQVLFTNFVSPCTEWISLCFRNVMDHPNEESPWFSILYTLEILNSLFALSVYEKPEFSQAQLANLQNSFGEFVKYTVPAALAHQKAVVIDQFQALFSKLLAKIEPLPVRRSSIKFPDQFLLEQRGYMIISSISSGRKILYKCLDQLSRRLVIIKRLAKSKKRSDANIDTELSTLMALQHTNIVRYLNCFEDESFWFMVMEYCDDTVNRCALEHQKFPSELEVCGIARQILNGLFYLHRNHIVHRDIKPGNILRDGRGFFKIADFGEAQLIPLPESAQKSSLLGLPGTPAYMAPECLHKALIHQSADVWSLACVLVYLISGQHPWKECNNDFNILYIMGTTDRLPYDVASLSCSDDMKRILNRMLERDPEARPSVAQLMAESIFVNVPESVI